MEVHQKKEILAHFLSSLATENPSTTLVPVPIELISPLLAAKRTT